MAFERISRLLRTPAKSSTGFVEVFDTELAEVPDGLLAGTKGLTAVQPVRRSDGKLSFVAYWASEADAEFYGPKLVSRLAAAQALVSGVAGEPISSPPPDLWGKAKDKAVPLLLTTVAVIAALEGLNNRYEALIASPQFTVKFDAPLYSVDEGDALTASLTVENALTGVELSSINVVAKIASASGGPSSGRVDMLKLENVSLPATKARSYFMSLESLRSGEHVITGEVTAEAGRFRGPRLVAASAKVVVWPTGAEASLVHKQTRQNRADFKFIMRVGKLSTARSVVCDLRFSSKLTVPNNYFRSVGKSPEVRWITGPERNVLKVTWPAVEGRSTHVAELSLSGDEGTDWKQVAAQSEPECSED